MGRSRTIASHLISAEQVEQLIACKDDLNAFCKLIGHHPIKEVFDLKQIMYPSREDIVVYLWWLITFNYDRTYVIVEPCTKDVKDTMLTFYKMSGNIPEWLLHNVTHYSGRHIEFDNGCKLFGACNDSILRGRTVSGVAISANLREHQRKAFYYSLMPHMVCNREIIEFSNGAEIWDSQ